MRDAPVGVLVLVPSCWCRLGNARAWTLAGLVGLPLLIASCGNDSRPDVSTSVPPEQVAQADQALSDLIRRKTDQLADALDKALPNNFTREHTVKLRLRICEVLLRAQQESNAVVRMVQLWFWAIAFHSHIFNHTSGVYVGQDDTLRAAATDICKGADEIVKKVLRDPGYSSLKKDLVAAASKGDAFYSIQPDQGSTFGQLMSATHLQSLLALPLAPFNALNGIGEGAKGLDRLSDVGDKLVALINAYPTMMHLQVQMLMLQIQNQDLPKQIGADLDRLTKTAELAVEVARQTPLEVKNQIESLVKETTPEQKNLNDMLDRATKTADSLRGLIESAQQLLVAVKPLLPPPPASGTVGPAVQADSISRICRRAWSRSSPPPTSSGAWSTTPPPASPPRASRSGRRRPTRR